MPSQFRLSVLPCELEQARHSQAAGLPLGAPGLHLGGGVNRLWRCESMSQERGREVGEWGVGGSA